MGDEDVGVVDGMDGKGGWGSVREMVEVGKKGKREGEGV